MIARHTRALVGSGADRLPTRRGTAMPRHRRRLPRQILHGKKAFVCGIANEHSIAYGCASAFRELGADLAITYAERQGAGACRAARARRSTRSIFMPLDVATPGDLEAVFDADREGLGPSRHPGPLDRLGAEGRPPGRLARLLGRRLRQGDGHLVPFVRAHGAPRGAADDGWRHALHHELPRRQQGRAELQRDGAGQGRARGVRALSRLRARPAAASGCMRSRPGR